ncbi:MAG: chemotaxis protein CheA [Desulfamplus sp.]|nr:chemotaxis protein CheA [Desulfamplus sp.]
MEEYDIDPEVLAGFIDETIENLQAAEQMFISLEESPDDIEIVNAIFRPIHSLKGTSGFFGLIKVKELAHSMENLLDAVRKGQKKATKEVINSLLPGIDKLNLIFQNVRLGKDEIIGNDQLETYQKVKDKIEKSLDTKEFDSLASDSKLDTLKDKASSDKDTSCEPPDLIGDIIEKLNFIRPIIPENELQIIDSAMEILFKISVQNEAEEEQHREANEEIKKSQSDEKPETPINIEENLKKDREEINLEQNLEHNKDNQEPEKIEAEDKPTEKFNGKERRVEGIGRDDRRSSDRRREDRRKGDRREEKNIEPDKTMRVSEKSIDSFLEYVGELVVVEEMFNYLQKKLASLSLDQNISKNFKRVIETFSTLSDSLRNSILEIRSVPAQTLLQKAPRIIRTVADSSGKAVDVIIEGESIRIDKSYVELLDAPLTHMVRNAVDHGIESSSERVAQGKPERGFVRISIQENRENIELTVSEDGRGLDLEAISAKAIDMGLVARGQKLDENKIIDMLFMSGVSTAKEITEVSGRGVGMDVVKRNIDSAGGFINVETQKGHGTTFKITLPKSVSTQIVDGFLVKLGNETYVLPMGIIGESFVPEKKDVSTVSGGKGEMVMRRGILMPVVHLSRVLGMDSRIDSRDNQINSNRFNQDKAYKSSQNNFIAMSDATDKVMITIEMGEKNYALCVDDILGVQKVVVKHVEALPVDAECFEGAAMMGDGSVAMIISVEGLNKIALNQN